ncbi:MAG: elongation factor P [Candidatus Omnitrophica bacterium]|nr:elongation factor P [Candidatus Omnitrophota bacterium]
MGISIGSIKPGNSLIYNGEIWSVVDCEHAKLARGAAFARVKLRNFKTGQVLECTLRDSDNIESAFIEKRSLQYLYRNNNIFHFMDLESYEDLVLDTDRIGDRQVWLKDNLEITGMFYENKLVDFELPSTMELKVVETEPGAKGNTVKMATKLAKLETGLSLQVPLFVEQGEMIKVDTRTGQYLGRA